VEAAFDGGLVTSDAGALLLGTTDRAIDLVGRFADCFRDHRRQDLIEHAVGTLVGQRVFGIALGPCTFAYLAPMLGVTFKLVQAILSDRGGLERAGQYLDVVAIGTIADVVPLVGENRVIARLGLERLSKDRHTVGLRALLDGSGLTGKALDSFHIGFVLAPRINAAGRMSTADTRASNKVRSRRGVLNPNASDQLMECSRTKR
jgi:hypothetical protein